MHILAIWLFASGTYFLKFSCLQLLFSIAFCSKSISMGIRRKVLNKRLYENGLKFGWVFLARPGTFMHKYYEY